MPSQSVYYSKVRSELNGIWSKIDAIDLALLAYILDRIGPSCGRTKVQKSVFLVEARLQDRSLQGPSFRFFRYNNGPFSRDLLDAYETLACTGHAHRSTVGLTERGRVLAELATELKTEGANRTLFTLMDAVLAKCKRESGDRLMKEINEMVFQPNQWHGPAKIREIPLGVDLIIPAPRKTLQIPPEVNSLIAEELRLSDAELQAARDTWRDWGRQPVKRLLRAIGDNRARA